MFWSNFVKLCSDNNKKPNPVAKELGFGSSAVTYWKKGTIPSDTSLRKIADYFGVTVDYLLGKEEKHSEPEVLPDKNVIRILGRDGRRIEKRLTDEQMQALQVLIDQLPDAPDDL